MPEQWQRRIRDELAPGESLVWAAQPLPTTLSRSVSKNWLVSLFGLFWLTITTSAYLNYRSFHDRWDADFEEHFQDDFFQEARERHRKETEGISMGRVMPLVIAGAAGLVGIGLVLYPVWAALSTNRRRARTCYALTTRRALVWEPGDEGIALHSYEPHRLDAVKRVERDDGSGDLVFEEYTYTYQANVAQGGGQPVWETRLGVGKRGFLKIPRVAQVERLLRQTLLP